MQRNTTGTFRATNTWKKTYLQSAQKCTFNQMNKYCISQGSVVTFFTCGGEVHSHSSFYSEVTK